MPPMYPHSEAVLLFTMNLCTKIFSTSRAMGNIYIYIYVFFIFYALSGPIGYAVAYSVTKVQGYHPAYYTLNLQRAYLNVQVEVRGY